MSQGPSSVDTALDFRAGPPRRLLTITPRREAEIEMAKIFSNTSSQEFPRSVIALEIAYRRRRQRDVRLFGRWAAMARAQYYIGQQRCLTFFTIRLINS
jgi:hypothetical protein